MSALLCCALQLLPGSPHASISPMPTLTPLYPPPPAMRYAHLRTPFWKQNPLPPHIAMVNPPSLVLSELGTNYWFCHNCATWQICTHSYFILAVHVIWPWVQLSTSWRLCSFCDVFHFSHVKHINCDVFAQMWCFHHVSRINSSTLGIVTVFFCK